MFPVLMRGADGVSKQYVRVRGSGRQVMVPTRARPMPGMWSVNAQGDLAFIRDGEGNVAILRARDSKAKDAATAQGVERLCWCGSRLCTVGWGRLHRHGRGAGPIAVGGVVALLSCTGQRVAWSVAVAKDLTRVTTQPVTLSR